MVASMDRVVRRRVVYELEAGVGWGGDAGSGFRSGGEVDSGLGSGSESVRVTREKREARVDRRGVSMIGKKRERGSRYVVSPMMKMSLAR